MVQTDRRGRSESDFHGETLIDRSFLAHQVDRIAFHPTGRYPTVNESLPPSFHSDPDPTRLDALETTVQRPREDASLGPCDPCDDIEVIFRHSGWRQRRNRVLASFERIDPDAARNARFATCGHHAWVVQSVADPEFYRVASSTCHDRFCVPCARARGRRVASRVAELSKNRKIRLVTLTLRINEAPLSDQITRLNKCYARLRRRKIWTMSQNGGISFVEIKRRAESHTWHPHLHILTEGSYVPKATLSDAWFSITGDSMIVDIKLCKSGEDAARYVAKYASKGVHGGVENDPEMLDEAITALKGRRLYACFGNWSLPAANDDVSPDEWRTVGTLRSLIERSRSGDLACNRILDLLTGEQSCNTAPRSPPDHGE